MILKFGKHRGEPLSRVPVSYLTWLRDQLAADLAEVSAEIETRQQNLSLDEWMQAIVAVGFKELAKRTHPDRGGSTAQMQALNAAVGRLRDSLQSEPRR